MESKLRNYIFISTEGYTFQPNSVSIVPDIDNCQVIGFSSGRNATEAYDNLLKENNYLTETNFNEIISYELSHDYQKNSNLFFIKDDI
jgi:hypothetical protein